VPRATHIGREKPLVFEVLGSEVFVVEGCHNPFGGFSFPSFVGSPFFVIGGALELFRENI
jgi:hypothetical protein